MRIFLIFLALSSFLIGKNYEVLEKTEDLIVASQCKIEEKKKQINHKIENENENIKIEYSKNYETQKYLYSSKKESTNYQFLKEKNKVLAEGIVKNKKIKKSHKLKYPWIQNFSLGFKPFVLSKKKFLKFVVLNPKDFSFQKLIAKKKGKEILKINKKNYEAQKIEISLPGFKKMFWKAKIWFCNKTNKFLKYEGNSGPKTPVSISMLKEL